MIVAAGGLFKQGGRLPGATARRPSPHPARNALARGRPSFDTQVMDGENLLFHLFLIFSGAAALATLALFARQALIIAYILLGLLLGPAMLNAVPDPALIARIADIGIIFLLFLLGLNLHPQKLFALFRGTLLVTTASSLVFAAVGASVALVMGLSGREALVVGMAMTFSSTIVGLKLLPTTVLHHQHTGELIISILLLQDIVAILCLLLVEVGTPGALSSGLRVLLTLGALPALVLTTRWLETHLVERLFHRFGTIQEYIFLLAIGWCLGIAEGAHLLGLSAEMGAFIAGVSIAASPISTFIAERLKPLRDFFLVLFFFALGAGLDLGGMGDILLPALALAGVLLALKPWVFRWLLMRTGEDAARSLEVGVRLGQLSEFSLLIAVLAASEGVIGTRAALLIQAATLVSFLASPYLIVLRYPTPIAVSERLRRD